MSDRASHSPIQILLVDDNPGDVALTTQALQESSIPSHLMVAEDGIEALALLRREGAYQDAPRPDLILLDLNLPRKDGRETLAEIAQDPELSHIPVVIITVSQTERSLLDAYNLAPNCYFVKPVDFEGFLAVVKSLDALAAQGRPVPLIQENPPAEEEMHILLSEDNPGDVELTRVRLQSAEQVVFTLEAVDEFAATMQRLEAAHFDILLLDLSVLEGRDLRASIEGFKRIANLPVVVLTGQDNEQLGVEAVKAGAEDYLVKGRVDSDLLMRSLRFAVERHRRKHLQDRLHQSQRLEEIGRLAGGVAHDFNNILTAIMGFTELACEAEPGGDDLPNYLGSIGKAAQRAADLTQQLLAFARKQTIQPRVLDLNECVYDMEKMLRRLISPNIVLTTQLAPHLWQVKADPGQMEQVIVNLIVNARDAMPNGGRIEMETANVSLDERGARLQRAIPGDYVLLSVRDTGEGMSAEVQSHIFEPFFTTKEKGKGTGLGLATCYGIIQQNGGIIAVESVPGEGTRFRIYLPCFQEAVIPTRRLSESTVVPSGGETILLIEDEPMVRQMAAQTLRKLGYVIEEAADGAEAIRLAKARNDHFDLVVTDVLMPGMSGKEVADHLLAMHPQTRFLFISGYTDNTIDQQGHLEEGIAFLQKPFTPTTLAQKVRRMLNADNNAVEGMR